MAAVTADNTVLVSTKHRDSEGYKVDFPVAASTTIYKDTFVGLDATGYLTSYVFPAAGATISGTSLRGIALEHVDNSAGAAAAKYCSVLVDGYFTYALSGVAVTDVGGPVFASDNATLVAGAGDGGYVGKIMTYDRSGYATIKLEPHAIWAGKFLSVVSDEIDFCTLNQLCMLVHETDNHNGLILCCATLYTTEIHACCTAAGVITITHTRGTNTSMGCTITAVDNQPSFDSMVGAGGCLWAPASASGDAIVKAPAGKSVEAKVTTQSNQSDVETGQGRIYATFMSC